MNGEQFTVDPLVFSDTGQWRLILEISASGMAAVLKNTEDEKQPPVVLLNKNWDEERGSLLMDIETAVYDNPRLLEDFATRIILTTPQALWVPSELVIDDEIDEKYFTTVYPAKSEDINADYSQNEICLYTLTQGLNSFLQRTLPGCRVSSHLSILKSEFEKLEAIKANSSSDNSPLGRIYLNIRPSEFDIYIFGGGRFLIGATHQLENLSEIAYKALLSAEVAGLRPADCEVVITGHHSDRDDLQELLLKIFPSISYPESPELTRKYGLSLALALAAGQELS